MQVLGERDLLYSFVRIVVIVVAERIAVVEKLVVVERIVVAVVTVRVVVAVSCNHRL